MDKINVLTMGGCAIEDILKCDRNYINLFKIDLFLGSLSRHREPGKVAARLKEEMHDILNKVTNPSDYDPVLAQILYVIKEHHTPYTLIDNLSQDTVVIIDPAYEIVNFYFDGNEIFDIHLNYYTQIQKYMPEWFNELIFKNIQNYNNGIMELAVYQYRTLRKFLRYLEKKNVPVIMVDNLFTKKILDERTKYAVDAISMFNNSIPFRAKEDVHAKYELITRFYDAWRDAKPKNFKLFSPDINMIYADPNHHNGYHPTHLHHTCRKILNNELKALIVEAVNDHKKKIILPTATLT